MSSSFVQRKGLCSIDVLFDTVVEGGYCIGCGACASLAGSPIEIALDGYGRLQATRSESAHSSDTIGNVLAVCPFGDIVPDESKIGGKWFGRDCRYDQKIGYHLATYAGYVVEGKYREAGSSGGMGTWIVDELLRRKIVDGVIHVKSCEPCSEDPLLFKYRISSSSQEIRNGCKSRYYPIEMSKVIPIVRDRPGRYVFVGIPCYVKAVRLIMDHDELIRNRIVYCIALVCGHLKSAAFADMLAWQCGVKPGNLRSIDFRKKLPNRKANDYGIEIAGDREGEVVRHEARVRDLHGTDWGMGLFKYQACDYCDDVVGETADLSVGDAWLTRFISDAGGTNVVVIRNRQLREVIEDGHTDGRLHLEAISAEEVAESQSAGFRHRRDGLGYRLHLLDRKSKWRPKKRVRPKSYLFCPWFRVKHLLRMEMARCSHEAFKRAVAQDDFGAYVAAMDRWIRPYQFVLRSRNQIVRWIRRCVAFCRTVYELCAFGRH